MPISEAEAMRILQQVTEGVERPKPTIKFEVGEHVKVAEGPFASFTGVVEEVDEERSRAQGRRVDFRPADAGRARIRASRKGCELELLLRLKEHGQRAIAGDRFRGMIFRGRCVREEQGVVAMS